MTHVYVSAVLPAPIDAVWALIGDFNSLPDWHPLVAASSIEGGLSSRQIGCVRALDVIDDGGTIREQLITLSDQEHVCRYSILSGPMAVRDYVATMWLLPVTTASQTFAQWEARFATDPVDRAAMVELVTSIFRDGFASAAEKLAERS